MEPVDDQEVTMMHWFQYTLLQFWAHLALVTLVYPPPFFKITLLFPRLYICVRTSHMRNNYVTYIVAMQPYSSRLRQFRRLPCVAAMTVTTLRWITRSRGNVDAMTRG